MLVFPPAVEQLRTGCGSAPAGGDIRFIFQNKINRVHKVIYDPSNLFYKDNHKKDEACKKIAEVVGVDGK